MIIKIMKFTELLRRRKRMIQKKVLASQPIPIVHIMGEDVTAKEADANP